MTALEWVKFLCPECEVDVEGFKLVTLDLYEVKPHNWCCPGSGAMYDGETIRGVASLLETRKGGVPETHNPPNPYGGNPYGGIS